MSETSRMYITEGGVGEDIVMKVYLASPFGFSELGNLGRQLIRTKLISLGHEVIDPWATDFSRDVENVTNPDNSLSQVIYGCKNLAYRIGNQNHFDLDSSDCVLAILDGQELDSGTVSELGYAVGAGKKVYGYRGDFRDLGELPGIPFNLQVWYFIKSSGGELFRSIDKINF